MQEKQPKKEAVWTNDLMGISIKKKCYFMYNFWSLKFAGYSACVKAIFE